MDCKKGFVKNVTLTAQNDDAGRRLDRILRKALPDYPLSALHRLLRKGRILVNGKPGKKEEIIVAGAVIELPIYTTEESTNESQPIDRDRTIDQPLYRRQKEPSIDILWEGAGLLILNKPSGLAVHGGNGLDHDNLNRRVQEYITAPPSLSFKPGPLHRLDKPSSGIVVFALKLEAAKQFSALLRERKICKRYLAVLEGRLTKSETWEDTLVRDKKIRKTFISSSGINATEKNQSAQSIIEEKEAVTSITPLAWAQKNGIDYTLARLEITTGRTHQIRAQAASHGHPLAGDRKYGGHFFTYAKNSFFLHAFELELPGEQSIDHTIPRIIKAPLPENCAQTVQKLFGLTI